MADRCSEYLCDTAAVMRVTASLASVMRDSLYCPRHGRAAVTGYERDGWAVVIEGHPAGSGHVNLVRVSSRWRTDHPMRRPTFPVQSAANGWTQHRNDGSEVQYQRRLADGRTLVIIQESNGWAWEIWHGRYPKLRRAARGVADSHHAAIQAVEGRVAE